MIIFNIIQYIFLLIESLGKIYKKSGPQLDLANKKTPEKVGRYLFIWLPSQGAFIFLIIFIIQNAVKWD